MGDTSEPAKRQASDPLVVFVVKNLAHVFRVLRYFRLGYRFVRYGKEKEGKSKGRPCAHCTARSSRAQRAYHFLRRVRVRL